MVSVNAPPDVVEEHIVMLTGGLLSKVPPERTAKSVTIRVHQNIKKFSEFQSNLIYIVSI